MSILAPVLSGGERASVQIVPGICVGGGGRGCNFAGFSDTFTYTTIDDSNATGTTVAYGINNLNQIVGYYSEASGIRGFVESGNAFSIVNYPGSADTFIGGINDNGQAVGSYYMNPPVVGHGFLYNNKVATPLNISGFSDVSLNGINNAGQIVGSADVSGILDTNGTVTTIQHPNASGVPGQTSFQGINSSGQIVGFYYVNSPLSSSTQGFVYGNGTFTDFPISYLTGINDSGEMVGFNGTYFIGTNSYAYIGGVANLIQAPGSTQTEAWGLNNAGDVVGEYTDSTGTHGFLATPVATPEPGSMLIMLAVITGGMSVRVVGKRFRVTRRQRDASDERLR